MASLAHSPHTSLPKLGHKAGAGQLMPRGTHIKAWQGPGNAKGPSCGRGEGGTNWGMKCITGSARGHLVGGDSQWYKRGHLEGAASRARP